MSLFDDFDDSVSATRAFKPDCEISCFACRGCRSPKLCLKAKKPKGYLFIAGEPTGAQDEEGTVWVGSYKTIIKSLLQKYKVDMDLVGFTFAAACHGVKLSTLDKPKYNLIIEACHNRLEALIEETDPAVIIPMDSTAWDTLTRGHLTGRIENASFKDDFSFHMIPDQTLGRWVAPILSPQYMHKLSTEYKGKDDFDFYSRKLNNFFKTLFTKKIPDVPDYTYLANKIIKCTSYDESLFALKNLNNIEPPFLAFDYETEGLKLERSDVHIVCIGFSCNDVTYAMPYYEEKEWQEEFKKLMTNPKIGKIAHHAKYEARCTLDKCGYVPEPWAWDSMYGARILDNSIKCGLKPQTYINFGIAGYDEMEYYLQTPLNDEEESKWGSNRRNMLLKVFTEDEDLRNKTLFYVGQDAIYTLELALKQMREIEKEPELKQGEELFRSFINPLVRAEVNGMVIDKRKVRENMELCRDLLDDVDAEIRNDAQVKLLWDEKKEGHPFDYHSSSDLGRFIYELAGIEPQYTNKGKYALDVGTLERTPLLVCDKILEARKIEKINTTYLLNLKKEAVLDEKSGDHVLHAVYNLHVADTFRSSSSGGINLQNIPVHDERANNLIRSCILPAKGAMIIGSDYKALEVTIGCSIHHDKNMLSFLENDGDMHKASMMDIFRLTDEDIKTMDKGLYKTARGYGKRMNFSAFYGAGAQNIGSTCWKNANYQPEIMEHLNKVGLGDYDIFMEHMKGVCDRLWSVQFPEYGQWKEDIYALYQKHGYVELIDGFKCRGPLTYMQAGNSPIQGPASHVLLWGLSQIDRELQERHMRSHIINEIHDAVYLNCYPEEFDEVKAIERKWLIEEAPNKFPWISAPLASELEYTKVREEGGVWSEMEEFGYI